MSTIHPEPAAGKLQAHAEEGTPPRSHEVAGSAAAHAESVSADTSVAPEAATRATDHHFMHDPRLLALGILSTLALLFALQWAQKFLIPLVFGIFISYTLNPVIVWLEKMKIPRVIGISLVMVSLMLGAGAATNTLQREFSSIMEQLPAAVHKIANAISKINDGKPSTVQQVQQAAAELEKATTGQQSAEKKQVAPVPTQPVLKITEWLWAGSMGAIEFIAQTIMVLFLVFFLLLSGDTFKRKLVKITGPTLARKKIAVHILEDINTSIQSYMFMLLVTNTLLALLMWIAFRLIGLENAGAWAIASGLFHLIPYFGPLIIMISSGVAAFMQFESISMALLAAGISLGVATLVGTFVTTWMVGKIARMNPAAVFISLLFWGWLWGVWGLLLGIPIVVIVKVIAENIRMEPIVEILGE